MKRMSVDIEAIGLRPLGGTIWMLSINGTKLFENCHGLKRSDIPAAIIRDLEDPNVLKIIHNGGGYDVPYMFLVLGIRIRNFWDSMQMESVIQGLQLPPKCKDEQLLLAHSIKLEYVFIRYGFDRPNKTIREGFISRPLGRKFSPLEKHYGKYDTEPLDQIAKAQEFLLTRDGNMELALLENKVAEKLALMKIGGIGFDSQRWYQIAKSNGSEFKRRLSALPREVTNWNSEKQVKAYFKSKGVLIESYDDLEDVAKSSGNAVLKDFIKARELHKSVTSYGLSWFEDGFIDADNRIRCDVRQIINTGRMAMANPNLQQLPREGLHRSAFIPRPGHCFIICDFTGQEIGIMAAGSGEDVWIEALMRGDDIHSLTASLLYANEWDNQTGKKCKFPAKCDCPGHLKLRDSAKVLNFMLAYGGGPMKFAYKTGVSELDAKMIVAKYKRVIPKLTRWLDKNGKEALATGLSYSADPYKRRRVLRGQEDWQIINQGKNNPIQAAGANMLKLALISVPEEIYVPLVIHDEIIAEVPIKAMKKTAVLLKKLMEQSADYITGIKGLIKVEPKAAMSLLKSEPNLLKP